MKLTSILLLITCLHLSASVYSQQTKLNLSFRNTKVREVLKSIEDRTDFFFLYTNEDIDINRNVTVNLEDADIDEILAEIFEGTNVSYKIADRQIILKNKGISRFEALQQQRIRGEVSSASGESLPGVTVVVKGTGNGTITDSDGKFTLSGIKQGDVIIFSFVGMRTQEIPFTGQASLDIVMEEEAIGLEEVVAVGYGVQKKSDITGAMVSVDAEEITSRPVSNAIQAMQGKAAGVDITSSERPGQLGNINIRGVRSLTASNSPLYVVDGIPLVTNMIDEDQNVVLGGIDNLNTNDIESIDVLKDASATAIYGSRGANGVIIITTKKGKSGRMSLNYSSSLTVESLQDDSKLMDAGEYIQWRRWAYHYSNPAVYPRGDQPTEDNDYLIFLGSSDPSAWANIEKGWAGGTWDGSKVATTDWTSIVTRTGVTQEHTLSASGGNSKMNGYVSFGYLDNKGTVRGQSYKRYTGKASFDITPKEWFSLGGSINGSYSLNEYGQSTVGRNSMVDQGGLYATARMIFSYTVPYDSDGNRVEYPGGDIAVKTVVDEWKYSQDQRTTYRTMGSFYVALDFGKITSLLDGLKYRLNFGPDFSTYRDGVYLDGMSVVRTGSAFASLLKSQTFSYTLDNLLYYDKTIGKHTLGVTLLQSQTKFNYEDSYTAADNIPFASQKWNALSQEYVSLSDWSSSITEKQLMSYMARLNYNFNQKYLLTVSGRYDGASQLAEGHKWTFFPSAALGWRMDQESFWDDVNWVDQLKLRVGVGVTGNSAINPYSTKGGLTSLFYAQSSSSASGSKTSTVLANQELGWEKTTQYNVGVDFSVLHGRISGVLDVYKSKTTDLLMEMTVPPITGYETTFANIGETKNKGVDLTLNTININTDAFQWTTNFNASWSKDRIVSLSRGKEDDIVNGWFINQSQGVIYGYESNGIWKEEDAAEMAKFNDNGHAFEVGMSRPVDQNGDYIIDANNDRVIIGNTRPKFILGMTNTFNYANFELSVFLFGRLGYWYDTGGEYQGGRFNQRKISYYNENNKNSDYQKPIYTEGSGDPYSGILGYKKASFIKIRNISLGYKLPSKVTQRWGIGSMKVYAQAVNPGTIFRKIDWIDMDLVSSNWNRGFTAGINVEF
jgi:TonB-linked SusC/RagA family outer membrane protein